MKQLLILFWIGLSAITCSLNVMADGPSSSDSNWGSSTSHLKESLKLIDEENYEGATQALDQILKDRPDDADVLNLLGFSFRKLEQFDKALDHYNRALEINPKHKGALEYLGELYLQTDQPDLAEAQLARLKKVCTFCKERKKLSKAIRSYKNKS